MAERAAMHVLALLSAIALASLPNSAGTVSVLYAGSLVRVMEGPVASALKADTGLVFSGEGKGSKALAHMIEAGLRTPDVFITADPKLLRVIGRGTIFASARMVVAYSDRSPKAQLFREAAQGKRSILSVLAAPGVRVGRTDPQLDPKGERTITSLRRLGEHFHDPAAAASILSASQVFPEEDLAVRVESGELDAGFFYSTEIPGRDLRAIELPADANLSSSIAYAIAVLKDAPHPQAAATFADFVLRGPGKPLLEQAGLSYFDKPMQTE